MIATALGSFAGRDYAACCRAVLGELEHRAPLPELPARGPGADMIGRSACLLPEMPVDLSPAGWRLCQGSSLIAARARRMLADDREIFIETMQGWSGIPAITVAGPLTLAACIDLPRGGRAIGDAGASHDIAQSWQVGVGDFLHEIVRLTGRAFAVQIDEPCLAQVLDGDVSDESGRHRLPPVDAQEARRVLAESVETARSGGDQVVLHCCADDPHLDVLGGAGADALSLDVRDWGRDRWDELAQWCSADPARRLWLGLVGADEDDLGARAIARRFSQARAHLDLAEGSPRLDGWAITPACGLASATGTGQWQILRDLVRVAADL
ncbi:5-methyltetrahydropteroyltriglutamate-homocysteine S-methyltransferase [Propionibacterium ruminifibrarum]|uniref:5-methyltetrahydropteroyltriglutamate-homocysteine S-methyltransferase n=1 Tax=Propionibacterium ruminifibrarum TaxID=1962131 RepID=A0A375I1A1_9ACTN|nr:methionine synthase [Propionibacterium ruminifibrarum]SPF67170.1 5-methyltetrahydropteroyltriglutamate-homocysteine S-methyltransferase [Propionibacterium ruminifibrarum]